MGLTARIVNALRRARRSDHPPTGRIVHPRESDSWRSYPADGLTPQRLVSILRAADAGDLTELMALYEQMEEKDPHLFSVASTRRLAITGLPWRIVSATEADADGTFDRASADDAAAYCRDVLRRAETFEDSLQHLALALGRNLAVAELVWSLGDDGPELTDVVPVEFSRLALGEFGDVRVLTDEHPHDGTPLPPYKFIVHRPHASTGVPTQGGLLRVSALAYLGKQFAIKDWLIFAEIFGMPVRIARYDPAATPEEKRELLEMLRHLGSDAAGIFSKAVELEIKQTRVPGDVNPYESLCHYFNRELSKAWLGQTLTTDTARAIANLSAAEVHDRVRRDLRDDDLRKEARTLRRDLLTPLTRLRFGDAVEPPYFHRLVDHPRDPEGLGRALAIAVNDLGLRIPAGWAHAALGVPQADLQEPVLPGRTPSESPPRAD